MLRFHKEGNMSILITLILTNLLAYGSSMFLPAPFHWLGIVLAIFLLVIVLQFFRNPVRVVPEKDNNKVYAPADGKVVVIEEVEETEYFKDKRLQVSIFMSPLNVHVNRNPVGGEVKYSQYHAGKYLVAWHPKASTENERTTVVINNGKTDILFRQIAGALAKRIVNYLKAGDKVQQGDDMGFIKFGSRVDLYLPLDAKIKVNINDMVKGNLDVIAEIA